VPTDGTVIGSLFSDLTESSSRAKNEVLEDRDDWRVCPSSENLKDEDGPLAAVSVMLRVSCSSWCSSGSEWIGLGMVGLGGGIVGGLGGGAALGVNEVTMGVFSTGVERIG